MGCNWREVALGDLGKVVGGATTSTRNPDYWNGDIAWLSPKDLTGYKKRYIARGERSITRAGFNSCAAQLLPRGSVLFSSRAPIGYVAIAAAELCTNQGFKSIVPNSRVDSLFLYYLLRYSTGRIESQGSGTTFKEVSGKTMRNIAVNIPEDLRVQKKIAAILDAIDSKIELNNQLNDYLAA